MIALLAPPRELTDEAREQLQEEGAIVIETHTPDAYRLLSDEDGGDLNEAPDYGDIGEGIAYAGFWLAVAAVLVAWILQ